MVRQWLVKADLTVFAYNRFQFFGDYEVGGDDLQLFVDVAGAETQYKITGLQKISHVAVHPLQRWLISDSAMCASHDFIDNSPTGNSRNRGLTGWIYVRDHNAVGIVEGADDIVVFGGGIIPAADIPELETLGVAKVFTPGATTGSIVDWVRDNVGTAAPA